MSDASLSDATTRWKYDICLRDITTLKSCLFTSECHHAEPMPPQYLYERWKHAPTLRNMSERVWQPMRHDDVCFITLRDSHADAARHVYCYVMRELILHFSMVFSSLSPIVIIRRLPSLFRFVTLISILMSSNTTIIIIVAHHYHHRHHNTVATVITTVAFSLPLVSTFPSIILLMLNTTSPPIIIRDFISRCHAENYASSYHAWWAIILHEPLWCLRKSDIRDDIVERDAPMSDDAMSERCRDDYYAMPMMMTRWHFTRCAMMMRDDSWFSCRRCRDAMPRCWHAPRWRHERRAFITQYERDAESRWWCASDAAYDRQSAKHDIVITRWCHVIERASAADIERDERQEMMMKDERPKT